MAGRFTVIPVRLAMNQVTVRVDRVDGSVSRLLRISDSSTLLKAEGGCTESARKAERSFPPVVSAGNATALTGPAICWNHVACGNVAYLGRASSGPERAEIRHDWGQTLTELINDHYLTPIREWAHQHGTRFRSQTYGVPAVSLSSKALVDLEGEDQWSLTRAAPKVGRLDTFQPPPSALIRSTLASIRRR